MSKTAIIGLTVLAMVAFATNSLLYRMALVYTAVDPASFTTVRLLSGAVVLGLIINLRRGPHRMGGNWVSALSIFAYAAAISFA